MNQPRYGERTPQADHIHIPADMNLDEDYRVAVIAEKFAASKKDRAVAGTASAITLLTTLYGLVGLPFLVAHLVKVVF